MYSFRMYSWTCISGVLVLVVSRSVAGHIIKRKERDGRARMENIEEEGWGERRT